MLLFRRRELWVPTWTGWLLIIGLLATPILAWGLFGESILARTVRVPADVLIVEAWIDTPGLDAAVREFHEHNYRWIVLTGGWTGESWSKRRWSQVAVAEAYLLRIGFDGSRIIAAETVDAEHHRTAASARAAVAALAERGVHPTAVNVFTRSVHAQRSRIIFNRAFGRSVPIGSIGWIPPRAEDRAWWRQTYRVEDLIEETVGTLYEAITGPFSLFRSH